MSFPLFFLRSLYLFVLRPAILLKFTKTKLVANKIISFDLISDASPDQTEKLRFFGTTAPPIPWEPSFCVLREDVKTLTFHKQEEVSSALLCSFICEKISKNLELSFLTHGALFWCIVGSRRIAWFSGTEEKEIRWWETGIWQEMGIWNSEEHPRKCQTTSGWAFVASSTGLQ